MPSLPATLSKEYVAAAAAWNSHADVLRAPTTQWFSLGALVAGGLFALFVIWLYYAVSTPLVSCVSRTSLGLQPPIRISIAPETEKRPYLRPPGGSRYGGGYRQQRSTGPRATAAQWNAMRAALGDRVPEKSVFQLLEKHGSDTKSAVDDFFGYDTRY